MATLPSTEQSQRIVTLDIIRGIAVMGIFSVNVIAFAMIEAAYFNPAASGGHTGADLAVWAANLVVIDGKMRSLFSMLFGASMLLVVERAEAAGASGWRTHWRRMAVLLGFGLLHYFLLWYGDILTLYAVTGLVAYRFRNMTVRKLLIWGSVFLFIHMLLFGAFMGHMYQVDVAAHARGAAAEAIKDWNEGLGTFYPTAAQIAEDRAIHLGGFGSILADKLGEAGNIVGSTLIFIPNTLGLMMLGMAGYKSGFLTGEWDDRRYRRFAALALALGAAAGLASVAYDLRSHFYVIGMFTAFIIAETPFITAMALGYAALIILMSRSLGPLAQRVAAAGRCAFSNYLGTSLVATFVFYGWGLGLYGSLSRWQAWLLVPVVWALMLLWSQPWLERFYYGPFEWAWRSLSRGKLQPFRKPGRVGAAAPAA